MAGHSTRCIDEAWHGRLDAFSYLGDLYAYLTPEEAVLGQLRRQFESSGRTAPIVLRPPHTYQPMFARDLPKLRELRADIAAHESDEQVRMLYLARIDELLANARLWLAADAGDAAEFERQNDYLYGMPDAAAYAATVAWLREFAGVQLAHAEASVRTAATALLVCLPPSSAPANGLFPDEDLYHRVSLLHRDYRDMLFAGAALPAGGWITAAQGDAIVAQVLRNIAVPYTIADATDGFWGVRHSVQQLLRPVDYRMEVRDFIGLVCHEVGSHLLERAGGLRSPLRLAATGLARFEQTNEGRAYLREQIALGSLSLVQEHYGWQLCTLHHLLVSVATGLPGKRYMFAEVHQLAYAVSLLWASLRQPDRERAEAVAAEQAWISTTRILKGTDGTGGAYRKDMVYLEGNIRCWQLAAQDPAIILLGDKAKWNIADETQHLQLAALGVL